MYLDMHVCTHTCTLSMCTCRRMHGCTRTRRDGVSTKARILARAHSSLFSRKTKSLSRQVPLVPLPSLASGEKPLAPAAVKPPSAAPAAPVMVKVAAPWYTQGTVLIESVVNERWLLEAGPDRRVGKIRGQEGGWTGHNCKPVVSADDNYYDRAMWKIVPTDSDGVVLIESFATERYLLEAGPDGKVGSIRGREGGWIGQNNKPVVSADNNYYDRALWKLVPSGSPNEFFIVSVVNERYLFETGPDRRVGNVRGLEEGWIGQNSKPVVSADDNYYDRARWKLLPGDHTPAPEKSLVPVPISQAPDPPNAVGSTGSTSGFVGGRDIWNAFILEGQPEPASPDLFIFR